MPFRALHFRALLPGMSLDQSQRLRDQPSSLLEGSWPVLGWTFFYLLLIGAWLGLAWATGVTWPDERAAGSVFDLLLARCLAPTSATTFAPLAMMWGLMSLGMMLPTSLPTLQRLALLVQQGRDGRGNWRFLAFILGYIGIWLGFSLLAAGLQLVLARLMVASAEPLLAVAVLAGAGLYQFSHLKHACLTRCRHPMTFFMANWRDGLGGAVEMGLKHGRDCLGCCWALMSLALIGGSMTLAWMGLGMVLMALEKLAGTGRFVTIPLGLILVAASGYVLGNLWFAA